ncbi:MAG: RNA polymerase sigma-70 factor (ECF subfamily) [Polaribacter sp.]|jgi:RNA polymerase sigma-70 factor (ECF subfamily)
MPSIQAHNNLDKAAFEQLFKSHFVHLCNFASQYVSDMDAARDICQKVFILLWENRESIKTDQNVRSYLFTSVKNRSLNYIRDQKKYRSHVLDIDIQDVDLAFEEDQLAVEDLKIKIEKALNALPEKCQLVFEMSRYEDKKYQEIADALDISKKTVEAHMSRALRSLRKDLGDYLHLLVLGMLFIG